MEKQELDTQHNLMESILCLVFLLVVGIATYILDDHVLDIIHTITIFEFVILSLAVFRLTRLLVYDKIMQFFRAFFWEKRRFVNRRTGEKTEALVKPEEGVKRIGAELLDCPWCVGMWMALFTTVLYYSSNFTHLLIFILALAGAATFIQITINAIGWKAEKEKLVVKDKKEEKAEN